MDIFVFNSQCVTKGPISGHILNNQENIYLLLLTIKINKNIRYVGIATVLLNYILKDHFIHSTTY